MVLGFISLLLTFGQNYIARICIPEKAANTMLPCPFIHDIIKNKPNKVEGDHKEAEGHRRLLLSVAMNLISRSYRVLNEASPIPACPKVSEVFIYWLFKLFMIVLSILMILLTMFFSDLNM